MAVLDPSILVAAASDGEAGKPYAEQLHKDARLVEVIGQAGFKDADSVAPYIFLSEVAGVRKVSFDVLLSNIGSNKINVIKIVRERTSLGLKEAKDLVEAAPTIVGTGLERAGAEAFAKALSEAGATATIQ